jgi:hypothetical protein
MTIEPVPLHCCARRSDDTEAFFGEVYRDATLATMGSCASYHRPGTKAPSEYR